MELSPGVETLTVTGAGPGAHLRVCDGDGSAVATLVADSLGGSGSTVTGGGGPGGTSSGSGGAGSGANGLVLSTNGGGPSPETLDPYLTGTTQFERATSQQTSPFSPGSVTNTFTSNFGYQQGFLTGTQLAVTFNNSRQTTTNAFSTYSPLLNTTLRA